MNQHILFIKNYFNQSLVYAGIIFTFTLQVFGNTSSELTSISILCGGGSDLNKPFAVLEFEINSVSGQGSPNEVFARKYSKSEFPFMNFRKLSLPSHTFRISAEIVEKEFSKSNLLLQLAIYEETNDEELTYRYSNIIPLTSIDSSFRFGYAIQKTDLKISCHVIETPNISANKNHKRENVRKPALKDK